MILTRQQDMHSALEDLEYDEIQSAFSPEIFYRGIEYSEEEAVTNLRFLSHTEIEARVLGSSRYIVLLAIRNGELTGECDCPYDRGPCKHIAAVLMTFYKILQKNRQSATNNSDRASGSHQLTEWPEPQNQKELLKQAEQSNRLSN